MFLPQNPEVVGHRALAAPADAHFDLHRIPETSRFEIAASDLHPGPADNSTLVLEVNIDAAVAEHLVFGGLHEDEKAGEVDDAADVGVGEIDAPPVGEDRRRQRVAHAAELIGGTDWR